MGASEYFCEFIVTNFVPKSKLFPFTFHSSLVLDLCGFKSEFSFYSHSHRVRNRVERGENDQSEKG